MSNPMIRIIELDGKIIDREMTNDEFAQYKKDQAHFEAEKVQAQAQATAKAELLERLGITADEARLLLTQ